jgi:hypothetical protein
MNRKMIVIMFIISIIFVNYVPGQNISKWVSTAKDGKLIYKTTPAGDKIIDFSYAGYRGGGVTLPDVPVKIRIEPSGNGKDDTKLIQDAIDKVAAMPLNNGFRGTVLLAPGSFTCSKSISLSADGIVLRGSGSGSGNSSTTINMTGDRHIAIIIGTQKNRSSNVQSNEFVDPNDTPEKLATSDGKIKTQIADAYVPAGAITFSVADASGFKAGDVIAISRPTTAAWIKFMEMDNLKRDGKPQTWIPLARTGVQERTITSISGNKITIDFPVTDSYDSKYLNPPGTTVIKVNPSKVISNIGVEHLNIQCPAIETDYAHALYSAIRVGGNDCWVKDVFCNETMNSTTLAGKRITMQNVIIKHTYPNLGASKPSDFSIEGSQILIDRCKVTGDNEYFVWTSSLESGPNVVLNSVFNGHGSRIQPHQRWATGLLIDNCKVPDGGIDFINRGVAGSGHGWTMGWGVMWNCQAKTFIIQNPPGVLNWAIGCIGARMQTARLFDTAPILGEGIIDSHSTHVAPQSLYLAQLQERLGAKALKNIGYNSNTSKFFADKSINTLPALSKVIDKELGPDLAIHRPVNTNNVKNNSVEFGGEKALDGNKYTYWATNDNPKNATFEVDSEGPLDINALVIEEADGFAMRVKEYKVEGQVNSDWVLLSKGTVIGRHKVDTFPKTTVWKVRLTILKADGFAAIKKFGLYLK